MLFSARISFSADKGEGLNLQQSIKMALESNLQISQARECIYGAEAKVLESQSLLYPQVNVLASYNRLGPISSFSFSMMPGTPPIEMKFGVENSYNAGVSLQHTLFNWGRTRSGIEVSQIGLKMFESNLMVVQNNVAYQVVQLFYGILVTKEVIKVHDKTITALENRFSSTKERFEAGLASKFDLLVMEVQIASAKSRKIEALSSLKRLELLFKKLLNRPSDSEVIVTDSLGFESLSCGSDSLIEAALSCRLELEHAKLQEEAALRQLEMTDSFNKPNLYLTVNYGFRNGYYPNPDVLRGNFNAGLGMSYPLFDGFKTSSQMDQIKANVKSTQIMSEDIKEAIVMEVKQAILDLQTNMEKILIEQMRTKQAEEALKIADERYTSGLISALDLLDSQTSLETAQLGYLQSVYSYTLSRYAVDRATGKKLY
jgi:outer membrane protein TolC